MIEQDLATPVDLPGGVTPSPPPEGFGQGFIDFGHAFTAAYKAERFDGDMFGRMNALSDAADRRNWDIQRSTGVQLENPLEGGYRNAARDRLMAGGVTGHIQDVQLQIHQEKLDALAEQFPDHAPTIGATRPLLADAKQLADYWTQRAARGEPGLNAVAGLGAAFLGGTVGFLRNPINAASLLIGGGEIKATGTTMRIAEAAARQGVVNAGTQMVAEPSVQAWRAERGHEAGFGEAAKDIGLAALFGAVPGGAIEGARIAVPALRGLMRGAEADRAVFAEPPAAKGLQASVEQALRHGEGVSEALPEMPAADLDRAQLPADKPQVAIIERTNFGPAFSGFEDDWAGAVAHLKRIETGDARGVLAHPDVPGRIDIVWGEPGSGRGDGFGLSKILAHHPEVVGNLPERLAGMRRVSVSENRINLESETTKAGVRLDYDGQRKTWLITAFEPRGRRAQGSTVRPGGLQADASSASPAPIDIGAEPPLVKRGPDPLHEAVPVGDDIFEAAARLRADPGLAERARASDAPDIRAAGRLASLGDAAFEEARSGRVDMETALAAAGRVQNEAEQLAVMRGAAAERPATPDEAAAAVTREMETRATPEALAALRAAEPAGEVPKPKFPRDIAKGADKQIEALTARLEREIAAPAEEPLDPIVVVKPKRRVTRKNPTLFEELADAGGLAPSAELQKIFDGNPFVPGFGRLLRKTGMSLDDALVAAKEMGYFFDPAEHGRGELTIAVTDLLDKLRDEAHGRKVYRFGQEPPSPEALAAQAETKARHKDALKALKATRELQPSPDGGWTPKAEILDRAAWAMAADDTLEPLAAWDRAAVAYERELWAQVDQFEPVQKGRVDEHGSFPGWDEELRPDAAAAPPERGASAQTEGGDAAEGGLSRGAGEKLGGDGGAHREVSADPLDLVPGDAGKLLSAEDALKQPTREEMIAAVVSRCPF